MNRHTFLKIFMVKYHLTFRCLVIYKLYNQDSIFWPCPKLGYVRICIWMYFHHNSKKIFDIWYFFRLSTLRILHVKITTSERGGVCISLFGKHPIFFFVTNSDHVIKIYIFHVYTNRQSATNILDCGTFSATSRLSTFQNVRNCTSNVIAQVMSLHK